MRTGAMVVLAATLSACTSVKMVQRDGCWLKQTEQMFGQVEEQLGVCERESPKWSEDRLTRLVQECMAQADYRWQNRALAAWGRGEPLPPQNDEKQVLETCLNDTATSAVAENEGLKSRLDELTADRSALRETLGEQLAHLRSNHGEMTAALGEAAKRPAPSAVATATSNGTATTQSDSLMQSPAGGAPVSFLPVCGSNGAPAASLAKKVSKGEGTGGSGQPPMKSSATKKIASKKSGAKSVSEAPIKAASEQADRAAPSPDCEPVRAKKAAGGEAEAGVELTKVTAPADPEPSKEVEPSPPVPGAK